MYLHMSGPLPPHIRRQVPPTWRYVGETPTEYVFVESGGEQQLGDISDMFKRMFKFTPKSFSYENITRSIYRLTPFSVAMQLVAPKLEKKIYKAAPVIVPIVAGVGAGIAFGPQIMSMLGPKLAEAGASAGTTAMKVGGAIMSFMGKMNGPQQAAVAQHVTPEQITESDRTGRIPESLVKIAEQYAPPSSLPVPLPAPGYAGYDTSQPVPQTPIQAGMMGDNTVLLLLGGTAIAVLFGQAQRKRR